MAQNTDKSTNRQSLEHELYNVRSRIKALREAAENATVGDERRLPAGQTLLGVEDRLNPGERHSASVM